MLMLILCSVNKVTTPIGVNFNTQLLQCGDVIRPLTIFWQKGNWCVKVLILFVADTSIYGIVTHNIMFLFTICYRQHTGWQCKGKGLCKWYRFLYKRTVWLTMHTNTGLRYSTVLLVWPAILRKVYHPGREAFSWCLDSRNGSSQNCWGNCRTALVRSWAVSQLGR